MLNSIIGSEITVSSFLICTAVSLVLGIGTALVGMFGAKSSQNFAIAVAILPTVVQTVIMLVNGNIGAGVAVAGAFGLVRFRSAPGTAKEICAIFLAMAIGLATGMGYIGLAALLFVVAAAAIIILTKFDFGAKKTSERTLKITIPENLDYDGLFDDIFEKYAKEFSLEKIKTSNMGTLYDLTYRVVFKTTQVPKSFLDELRCRNGNLNIICGKEISSETL